MTFYLILFSLFTIFDSSFISASDERDPKRRKIEAVSLVGHVEDGWDWKRRQAAIETGRKQYRHNGWGFECLYCSLNTDSYSSWKSKGQLKSHCKSDKHGANRRETLNNPQILEVLKQLDPEGGWKELEEKIWKELERNKKREAKGKLEIVDDTEQEVKNKEWEKFKETACPEELEYWQQQCHDFKSVQSTVFPYSCVFCSLGHEAIFAWKSVSTRREHEETVEHEKAVEKIKKNPEASYFCKFLLQSKNLDPEDESSSLELAHKSVQTEA